MSKSKKTEKAVEATEASTKVREEAAKKQEENKDGLRIDPTITNSEAEKAAEIKEQAKEAKAETDAAAHERANVFDGIQVDNQKVQGVTVVESAELKAAVKKDADARGKVFEQCPISGVLVVR